MRYLQKSVNWARPLKLLRSFSFCQHRVFLSSVTRAALWSSRFQEKNSHVSLGHTNMCACMHACMYICRPMYVCTYVLYVARRHGRRRRRHSNGTYVCMYVCIVCM